jgi:hypothetical protein
MHGMDATTSLTSLRYASARAGISRVMFTALRYYWITAKGYRLRPWASPYIRWRLETFFGGDMHALGPAELFHLIWRERKQLRRFLAWTAERWRVQSDGAPR